MIFGMAPLPIWFTTEDLNSCSLETQNNRTESVSQMKLYSTEFKKETACFCLAQKNAQTFSVSLFHINYCQS